MIEFILITIGLIILIFDAPKEYIIINEKSKEVLGWVIIWLGFYLICIGKKGQKKEYKFKRAKEHIKDEDDKRQTKS